MKLLNKTNIYTSFATIILLFLGISIVFLLIQDKIDSEQDEHLLVDKSKIIDRLSEGKPLVYFNSNVGEKINVQEIPTQNLFENKFRDYQLNEEGEDEDDDVLTYRELLFQTTIGDKHYEVTISHSLSEGKEIGEYVASAIIIFLIFSLITLFILNRYISKRIWAPFYNTLAQIKNWTIQKHKPLDLTNTNIDEFSQLNHTINGFIQKITEDYQSLKQFTENMSHETQTPVSIITAKLELLMQEDNYSNKQQQMLMDAYKSALRLKKLNQTLVSIARIENHQYVQIKFVNLKEEIEEKINELNDFIQAKNIRVSTNLAPVEKSVNAELLNMLLNNLFINAIKHNLPENGFINITLNETLLRIENSGADHPIDKEEIFERFKRYSSNDDSIGLGLSIIKKIVNFLNWNITYSFSNAAHTFTIFFEKDEIPK